MYTVPSGPWAHSLCEATNPRGTPEGEVSGETCALGLQKPGLIAFESPNTRFRPVSGWTAYYGPAFLRLARQRIIRGLHSILPGHLLSTISLSRKHLGWLSTEMMLPA